MSEPLDLAAVEARLRSHEYSDWRTLWDDAEALLAYTRALRAALRPFAAWYDSGEEEDDARPVTLDSGKATIYYQGHNGQPVLMLGTLKRAAAVLAAAQDGPA